MKILINDEKIEKPKRLEVVKIELRKCKYLDNNVGVYLVDPISKEKVEIVSICHKEGKGFILIKSIIDNKAKELFDIELDKDGYEITVI